MKAIRPSPGWVVWTLMLLALASSSFCRAAPHIDPRTWQSGDIVFENGVSWRSAAVRWLGESRDYSHLGVVVVEDGAVWIVHADPTGGPGGKGLVVKEPWKVALSGQRVSGGAVYRLGDAEVARIAAAAAEEYARQRVPFDHEFRLANPRALYCTALVWRAYLRGGVELRSAAVQQHKYLFPSDLLDSGRLARVDTF